MKATGIVRRIDDLGRIVIPKEIRRSQGIHEGDPLEIYLNEEGGVTFKKYSSMRCNEHAVLIAQQMGMMSGMNIGVYDTNGPVAVPTRYPRNIPKNWYDHGTEPFYENDYYVCGVFSNGDRVGFAVSNKSGAELTMIIRYLSLVLSD